jgi:hypothetical protein
MRGRMNAGPSYAPPERIDPLVAPVSTALGVLGMRGLTAYTGLLNIGQPKAGETVVVAAASGAVGSVVGQIAKIKGCRAVGVAGSQQKCDFVRNTLGFDDCVNHRSEKFAEELRAACPKGIDVYFENVGRRVPVCGLIAHYSAAALPKGTDHTPLLMSAILTKRLTFRGFIVIDFASQKAEFERDMAAWLRERKVKCREDIVDGLENAVGAFRGLLLGRNFGKLLVRMARRAPESHDAAGQSAGF